MEQPAELNPTNRWKIVTKNTAYILAALIIFLFTLDLMIASLQHLGKDAAEVIILATSNPFTGLFIGLLVTALIQSSSATTSMVVALVASGSISMEGAIPIIMGANVGTTITSTIVSLGFITKKKEFRRAVSIGTYHDFFNILTVVILFPLEYYFGFLSGLAHAIATDLFDQPVAWKGSFTLLGPGFHPIIEFIVTLIDNGFILAILSIALLFGSILFFRKVLSQTLGFGSQERFRQFFFKNELKSFAWGLLTTAAIRSSTVTTSLVVPLVAKKIVKLKAAMPFVLGANIGTTITAFIAAMFNSNAAISIAIAHFLFNAIGVCLFFPLPFLKEIPMKLADGLGRLTLKYRLAGFLYVLLTFFFIPFSLIYFNKNAVQVQDLSYRNRNHLTSQESTYTLVVKKYKNQPISNWMIYDRATTPTEPSKILSVYRKENVLLINKELFEFNKPGFCRDGEDEFGKYQNCILQVISTLSLTSTLSADSVFVFEKHWENPERTDSTFQRLYISATLNLMVRKEKVNLRNQILATEELFELVKK